MKKLLVLFIFMAIGGLRAYAQSADTLKFAAHQKEISTFINSVNTVGLNELFSGQPVTIFAPDNKTFGNQPLLDSLLKTSDKPALSSLLNNYMVAGKLTAKDISVLIHQNNGQATLTTLSGKNTLLK